MADEKQAPQDEDRDAEARHDDLELPEETAAQVKGGLWDWRKTPQKKPEKL